MTGGAANKEQNIVSLRWQNWKLIVSIKGWEVPFIFHLSPGSLQNQIYYYDFFLSKKESVFGQ